METANDGAPDDDARKPASASEELLAGEELSQLLENAPIALDWIGPDGTILKASAAALKLLGYAEKDYVGRNIAEFHVDELTAQKQLEELEQGPELQQHAARLRAIDGGVHYVLIHSRSHRRNGRLAYAQRVLRDTTEERRSTELRERLAAIVESSDDAIVSKDLNGVIQSWNRGAEQIFGYTAEEMIGKPVSLLAAPGRADEFPQILARIRRGERVERFETERMAKDGRVVTVSLSVFPVHDASGAIIGAAKIARDITEQKHAAEVRDRLAAIVDSAQDAIVSKDLNGMIRSWNKGAERMFGYTAAEAVGRPISMLAESVERLNEFPAILARIRQGERIEHYQTRRKTKDGRVLTVSLAVSPIRDAAGVVVGASKIARDITGEIHATEVQERLAAIVESSEDAIIGKDLDGFIRSWNRGAERIFGYLAAEIIGKPVATLAVPGRVDEIPDILERIRRGERVDHYETQRQTKDGRILNVSLTVSPIRDSTGTIIGASKVARDITERVQTEERLRKTNLALSRANADLEQFAYSASHDLREPLRMVAAYSQMLKMKFGEQLGEEGDEYIRYTVEGAHRMEHLLRDILAYTQASTHEDEPRVDVDANDAVEQALANLHTAVTSSGAVVTHGPLPKVRIYRFKLEQLFQNLIANAIRYRREEPPRVQITAESENGFWRFAVSDNGMGIEPEYRQQIFELFKRLHSNSRYPGSGLGLSICRRIVDRAGGRIWVESEFGAGSTFYFTIPMRGEDVDSI